MGNSNNNNGFTHFFKKKISNFLVLGLDGVGKSTLLYKMNKEKVVSTIPTIGLCVETLQIKNFKFLSWDLANADRTRILWRYFYQNISVIIYVVDSIDQGRIQDANLQLQKMLDQQLLKNASLLILVNKKDISLMSNELISQKLGLYKLKNRQWHIQSTCGLTGEGLQQGLNWIRSIQQRKK